MTPCIGFMLFSFVVFVLLVLYSFKHLAARAAIQRANANRNERILLLITAHPDDESMFFIPSIRAYESSNIYLLCLSNGNVNGLGHIRARELKECCASQFGIPPEHVTVVDHEHLQDGKDRFWSVELVAQLVKEHVSSLQQILPGRKITIVSFDEEGISSHPNHMATHFGVKEFARVHSAGVGCAVYKLNTVPFYEKFFGPLAVLWNEFNVRNVRNEDNMMTTCTHVNESLGIAYEAMARHASQFVWYRRLFLIFSCYTFINNLSSISTNTEDENCKLRNELK